MYVLSSLDKGKQYILQKEAEENVQKKKKKLWSFQIKKNKINHRS